MLKSKKIQVCSFALFQAILMAYLGLVAGILYSFGGFFIDLLVTLEWITSSETPGLSYGTVLAFGALLGMPILFGAIGYIAGVIEALAYNVFSKWLGQVRINF
jgi:hypothetical protein